MDCGASESIVGAWTLQQYGDTLNQMGFKADDEIEFDTRYRKNFVFGNSETSTALGHARINAGIHGNERQVEMHVLKAKQTPMLLSGKWLYEQEAVVDFKRGQALFPKITGEILQLDRAQTHHLLLPVTAFLGNESARDLTRVQAGEDRLLRALAQLEEDSAPQAVSPESE